MSQSSTPPRSIDLEEFERRLREPQTTSSSADPLSELARLVGGTGRDPFANVFNEQPSSPQQRPSTAQPRMSAPSSAPPVSPSPYAPPQAATQRPQASSYGYEQPMAPSLKPAPVSAPAPSFSAMPKPAAPHVQPQSYDYAQPSAPPMPDFLREAAPKQYTPPQSYAGYAAQPAPEAYASAHPQTEDAYPSYQHEQHHEQGYDPAHYSQNDGPWMPQDQYATAPADFGYPEPKRSHRMLVWIGAFIVLIIAGFAGVFTMRSISGPKEAPVIAALTSPTKIQPEKSDSDNASDPSATVLDHGKSNDAQAKVVNREEQPVDLAQAQLRPKQTSPSNGFPEPKKVRTVSVRPDGTIIDDPSAPSLPPPTPLRPTQAPLATTGASNSATAKTSITAPSVPAQTDAKAATPKSAQRSPTTPSTDTKPQSIAQVISSSSAPAQAPSPTASKAAPAPAATGTFAVQFSSSPSETEASASLARVKERFSSVLGAYRPSVAKGDANGHTVYRVRVSGLDRPKAVEICENIRSNGGTCFVAAN